MRRLLGVIAVAALATAAALLPAPETAAPDDGALVPAPTAASVCPVILERTTDGSVTLSGRLAGEARATAFANGGIVSDTEVSIGADGGARIPFDAITVAGEAGLLVEQPELDMGVGVSILGRGVAEANCTHPGTGTAIAVGASTRGAERLDLVLVNPYAVDAIVSVSSSSEAGVDSATELETVVVPSGSVVTRDLAALLPLRNRLSVTITSRSGQAHGFLVQEGGTDRALIEAVTPGASWLIPLGPAREGATETVVAASSSSIDVPVRVDALVDGGWVEGVWEDTIAARAQAEIDLTQFDQRPDALRVGADGLIVASLVVEDDNVRAASPGVSFTSPDWFIAGGAAGDVQAVISVVGDLGSTVTIFPHQPGLSGVLVDVDPGTTDVVPLPVSAAGYTVQATSDVIVMWTATTEDGLSLGAGVPVAEVGE